MRDIKFKYWWQFENMFLEQVFTLDQIEHHAVMDYVCSDDFPSYPLTSSKRQFTGLTDKNGVDIYEGDILINDLGRICKVEWHEYQAGFDCVFVKDTDFKRDIDLSRGFRNHQLSTFAEIIGNIHQNKDLLGG